MLVDIINSFRFANNKPLVLNWLGPLSDHCVLHSLEMAKRGYIYHSEECYRPDYGEIVAMGSFIEDVPNSLRNIIFNLTDKHKEALLNWSTMGYGFYVENYTVYLTIRGH